MKATLIIQKVLNRWSYNDYFDPKQNDIFNSLLQPLNS